MQSETTSNKSRKSSKEKTLTAVEIPKVEAPRKARATKSSPTKSSASKKSSASPKHRHSAAAEKIPVPVAVHQTHGHDDIARLAHSFWVERNYGPGSPDEDWLRAERELTLAH